MKNWTDNHVDVDAQRGDETVGLTPDVRCIWTGVKLGVVVSEDTCNSGLGVCLYALRRMIPFSLSFSVVVSAHLKMTKNLLWKHVLFTVVFLFFFYILLRYLVSHTYAFAGLEKPCLRAL